MARFDGRTNDQMRTVSIQRNYLKYPEGSVLVSFGDTKVICTATVEEKVPHFLKGSGEGWVTAEYSLLPRSTQSRNPREAAKGKVTGRTQEIQRLIGRSLRGVCNMKALGERTILIDCDVIQADGGTRTASITGAFVALVDAVSRFHTLGQPFPVIDFLAAISVGVIDDQVLLDLCYEEDSRAGVDLNLVMTGSGQYIEVQGTGEKSSYSRQQLDGMLAAGETGINQLIEYQKEVLGETAWKIGRAD
ncbi:MAG: Ribonuclease [Anaerosporomusa subterranea]|nr:Ribonuclease [Anaerosporomusa subterranea]